MRYFVILTGVMDGILEVDQGNEFISVEKESQIFKKYGKIVSFANHPLTNPSKLYHSEYFRFSLFKGTEQLVVLKSCR
jgi:hypothetical protein